MTNQAELKDQAVTLYLDGLAHIVTSAELPQGQENIVLLTGVTNNLDIESLHTALGSRDTEILESRVLEPQSVDDIVKGFKISKKVPGVINPANIYTVHGTRDGFFVVTNEAGNVQFLDIKTYGESMFLDDKTANVRRTQRALELKLANVPKDNQLHLSYLTSGISITPNYTLTLTGDKLVLAADVGVNNQTGREFKDVLLTVIPGEVNVPYLPRSHRDAGSFIGGGGAVFAMHAMVDGVEAAEDEGQISYKLGNRNLSTGKSKFSMFKTKELDYNVKYQATLTGRKPGINTTLTFKAPDTLTLGQAAVYRERETVETYEGGGTINSTLKDQEVSISLRTPDTLELKVEQQGKTEVVNTGEGTPEKPLFALQRTYTATARNAGQEDVTLQAYFDLSEFQRITQSSLDQHKESSGKRARWDINVKAGSQPSFTYTVQELRFTPMDQDEVQQSLKRR